MNIAKAIEQALSTTIRQNSEIGPSTQIRPWQSLNEDGKFNPDNDRAFPACDIRFNAPVHNEDQVTLACRGSLTAMTYTLEDINHQVASAMFEAVHGVLLSIFSGAMGGDATIYNEFTSIIADLTDNAVHVGGVTFEEGQTPTDSDTITGIGVGFAIHFTYA